MFQLVRTQGHCSQDYQARMKRDSAATATSDGVYGPGALFPRVGGTCRVPEGT